MAGRFGAPFSSQDQPSQMAMSLSLSRSALSIAMQTFGPLGGMTQPYAVPSALMLISMASSYASARG